MKRIYGLSPADANLLQDMAARFRAGELGRPLPEQSQFMERANFAIGRPDATVTGTTGTLTDPGSGTVSMHRFTSTGGTCDTGQNVTAYNLATIDATTDMYVVMARDYATGNWLIIPMRGEESPGYVVCSRCAGTGNNATKYMTVVLEDFINGDDCSVCENYNGTWVLTNDSTASGDPCKWVGERAYVCSSSTSADWDQFFVVVSNEGGFPPAYKYFGYLHIRANVIGPSGGVNYEWKQSSGSSDGANCLTLDNEQLPYVSGGTTLYNPCDGSVSTYTIYSQDVSTS